MTGIYRFVLANKGTPKRIASVIKLLESQGLAYEQSEEEQELFFQCFYETLLTSIKWREKHLCVVIRSTGVPQPIKVKKPVVNPLYKPFKGPSPVEFVPTLEDLIFFAETAKQEPLR